MLLILFFLTCILFQKAGPKALASRDFEVDQKLRPHKKSTHQENLHRKP